MSENIKYCWDEFRDWCEDNKVSIEYNEDWEPWWNCWKTAIQARIAAERRESE